MKFLCGRPGCGKESTATLQIDAPSETVALVDPRISRDGVPLCARHADATSPPLGWTMNDLRSRNRALSAVPDEGSVPTSTPPRVRPERTAASERSRPADPGDGAGADAAGGAPAGQTMPRRQSIAERVRRTGEIDRADAEPATGDHKFRSSRPPSSTDPAPAAGLARSARETAATPAPAAAAPDSRPTRRRDVPEDVEEPEERFPWHHQYHDDEPEEMQASSPLLSRAFRSSTG